MNLKKNCPKHVRYARQVIYTYIPFKNLKIQLFSFSQYLCILFHKKNFENFIFSLGYRFPTFFKPLFFSFVQAYEYLSKYKVSKKFSKIKFENQKELFIQKFEKIKKIQKISNLKIRIFDKIFKNKVTQCNCEIRTNNFTPAISI